MNIPGACWPARVAKSVSSGFKKTLPQNIRSRATAEDSVDNGHTYIHTHKRKKKLGWEGVPSEAPCYKCSKENTAEQTH